jgi:hypothetical protein
MPIDYRVDHEHRLVLAEGRGDVTAEDIFKYQREAWGRADVQGYDEVVDMSAVGRIVEPTREGIRAIAELSSSMDPPGGGGKFAIVAPQDVAFGLGRMYEAYRDLVGGEPKRVAVFRERAAAMQWIADPAAELPIPKPGR